MRDIVENDPEQIHEVWCRKLLRQLLQVLERQYTMRLPHRAITPDTVIFDATGAPSLLPSLVSDPAPEIANDLAALARLVHYAITHEPVPTGPLQGRVMGYSDSLITTIDRAMASDPARRPRTVGHMRDLLGIVVAERTPLAGMRTQAGRGNPPPSFAPQALQPLEPMPSGRMRIQHWAMVGGGVAILLLMGHLMFARLHGPSLPDHVVLPLPQSGELARARPGTALPPASLPALPYPEPPASHAMAAPGDMQAHDTQADNVQADNTHAGESGADADDAQTGKAGKQANGNGAAEAATSRRIASAPAPTPGLKPTSKPARDDSSRPAARAVSRTVSPAAAQAPAQAAEAASARPSGQAPATTAVFTLQIQPWGVIHVDGVERGISPPIKQLVLAPGRHSILVSNPGSRNRVLEVDTARGGGHIAVNFDNESP